MAVLTKKCKRTAIGLVTGFANGLFGSGGGTIVGVYLWKADVGAVWRIALWASAGGLVGGFVGAKLLQRVSGVWLHRIFGAFMLAAAVRLIL